MKKNIGIILLVILIIVIIGEILFRSANQEETRFTNSNEIIKVKDENAKNNIFNNNIYENSMDISNTIEESVVEEIEVDINQVDVDVKEEESIVEVKRNENEDKNTEEETKENEDTKKTKDEKAIELVKKEWGKDDSVYFTIDRIVGNKYDISVRSKKTTQTLTEYEVDISKETVEIK